MKQEKLRQELLTSLFPLVGGEANVARKEFRKDTLHITLKDQSLADTEALRTLDGVTGVELTRGRLRLSLTETYFEEEHTMADNKQIAQDILSAVGGKENVSSATHCMTRLRLTLKDAALAPEANVKNVNGVLGVVQAGGQYQIIVGQNVPKVYAEFCAMTGLTAQEAIDENLDGPKEKLTLKKIGGNILGYLSGSMTPLIPIMMAAGMLKMVLVLFCDLLHVLPAESDLYILLNFIYDAGFKFMPIFVGYHAAKKIGMTPTMGLYLGAVLIAPAFVSLVSAGTPFTILGIGVTMKDYHSSVLPIILTVAVAYPIEKLWKKIIPDSLSTIFVPTLTIALAAPIGLLITAPAGFIVGDWLGLALQWIADNLGFVGLAIIAGLWEYLVMTGMHGVLVMPALMNIMAGGVDPVIFVAGKCATFAACGMALGTFLRMKNKEEKSAAAGFFISGLIGGVTEPVLYGIGLKYKRPFIAMSIGAAIGGAYNGIMGVTANLMASSNFLGVLAFSGGSSSNFINGTIGCCVALIASTIFTYFIGYSKEEIETGKPRA